MEPRWPHKEIALKAYCVNCKSNIEMVTPVQVELNPYGLDLPKPTSRYQGTCPVCNRAVYKVERETVVHETIPEAG